MKILHVTNINVKWDGEDYWAMSHKLSHAFIRLGHYVFNFCDRDIADSYFLGMRKIGRSYVNRKLLKACEKIRPDLILMGHCNLITLETVRKIREKYPEIRLAQWTCDWLRFGNLQYLRDLQGTVDAIFATTGGQELRNLVVKSGAKVAFMPNLVDSSIETQQSFARPRHDFDLVLVSSPGGDKTRIADMIRNAPLPLRFGVRGLLGEPEVRGAELFSILGSSRMGLNLSAINDVCHYSSDRMSLLMGNGLLTFIDRRTRFDTIFSDDEVAFFSSDEELLDRIDYFNTHDKQCRKVAENGWRRIHQIFDGKLVAQWILDITFGRPPSHQYAWPTDVFVGPGSQDVFMGVPTQTAA